MNSSRSALDSKAKILKLVNRKKREDPEGFQKAARNNDLVYYLGKELEREGIDASVLRSYLADAGSGSSRSRAGSGSRPAVRRGNTSSSSASNDIDQYVATASDVLDELIYDPVYCAVRANEHTSLVESMAAVKNSSHIGTQLGRVKVFSAFTGLLCLGYALSSFSRGGPIKSLVLLLFSADLFRVSFNCYTKNYCSIFLHTVGGDINKLTKTVFQFAKTAVGMSDPAEDPFIRLKHEVMWELLLHKSFVEMLIKKVRTSLK